MKMKYIRNCFWNIWCLISILFLIIIFKIYRNDFNLWGTFIWGLTLIYVISTFKIILTKQLED